MSAAVGRIGARIGPFGAILLLGLLGTAGLAAVVLLALQVAIPLASACVRACARDPALAALAGGAAGLSIAVTASGLPMGLAVLAGQLRATRRLVSRMEACASMPPVGLARTAARLGMEGRITYVVDPAAYAFCYGFLRPRVCVSSGMVAILSSRELRAVLLHERFHLLHRDPLKVLTSRLVAAALFLLPVAAQVRDRYLLEKELEADAHVVERMSARPLARALLKICRDSGGPAPATLAEAAIGPFNAVGARIRRLVRPSEGPPPLRGGSIAASLAVAALVLVAAVGSSFAAEHGLPRGATCCASGTPCDLSASESLIEPR